VESFKCPTARIDTIDHDSGKSFSGRSLESVFPSRIHIDEVENSAEDTVDAAQSFRAGTGTRFIEGKRKGFDACLPGVVIAFGGTVNRLG
jgi:hypothetical protein